MKIPQIRSYDFQCLLNSPTIKSVHTYDMNSADSTNPYFVCISHIRPMNSPAKIRIMNTGCRDPWKTLSLMAKPKRSVNMKLSITVMHWHMSGHTSLKNNIIIKQLAISPPIFAHISSIIFHRLTWCIWTIDVLQDDYSTRLNFSTMFTFNKYMVHILSKFIWFIYRDMYYSYITNTYYPSGGYVNG